MSFIYPYRISITRPQNQAGSGGKMPYGGMVTANETPLFSDIPASIQQKSISRIIQAKLPGDVRSTTIWRIFFVLPVGSVKDRDIITDNIGRRFQVNADYWNSLGYNILAELLET